MSNKQTNVQEVVKEFEPEFNHEIIENDDKVPDAEQFFKNKPEFKAIGYIRTKGNRFVSYVLTIKDGQIVKYDLSEPGARLIAENSAKTNFGDLFMGFEEEI